MTKINFIGIDPGTPPHLIMLGSSGKIRARYNSDELLRGYGKYPELDPVKATDFLRKWYENVGEAKVVIESVGVRRGEGIASASRFFAGARIMETAAYAVFGEPPLRIDPRVWKRHFGLTSDKNLSVELARKRFPDKAKTIFRTYGSHNFAEAALLALYGKETI